MYVYLANYYCSSVELASDGETKRRAFIFIYFIFSPHILFLLDHDGGGGLHMEITSDVSTYMFFFTLCAFNSLLPLPLLHSLSFPITIFIIPFELKKKGKKKKTT